MVLTMALVMIVVMIESTGMFLALSDSPTSASPPELAAGLRTDGLGTHRRPLQYLPYTSFSQNVGLVGVTGVKSRWVCNGHARRDHDRARHAAQDGRAGRVGSRSSSAGGAGLVMFGMVAATGIRILANVDFRSNRNNPTSWRSRSAPA